MSSPEIPGSKTCDRKIFMGLIKLFLIQDFFNSDGTCHVFSSSMLDFLIYSTQVKINTILLYIVQLKKIEFYTFVLIIEIILLK